MQQSDLIDPSLCKCRGRKTEMGKMMGWRREMSIKLNIEV